MFLDLFQPKTGGTGAGAGRGIAAGRGLGAMAAGMAAPRGLAGPVMGMGGPAPASMMPSAGKLRCCCCCCCCCGLCPVTVSPWCSSCVCIVYVLVLSFTSPHHSCCSSTATTIWSRYPSWHASSGHDAASGHGHDGNGTWHGYDAPRHAYGPWNATRNATTGHASTQLKLKAPAH